VRFASLGSGSEGNGLVVEQGATRLLLDCGFTLKETEARLARAGLGPADLTAILVTHEHDDHIGGVYAFARRYSIPVYLSHGTLEAYREGHAEANTSATRGLLHDGFSIAIGDLEVTPFTVPHDAREPLHYVFSDGGRRLGVLTDTGVSTPHIESMLSGCDALVLETNHDLDMLWGSDYPQRLKERIAGRFGHLDNGTSRRLLESLDRTKLKHVIAAHLSKKNNSAELARAALEQALGCEPGWVGVASQDEGFAWRDC
jgi:phosphoribosyl 1,2-cyclic phosphodiesterase